MSRGIPTHFLSHREVGPHQLGGLFSMLDVAIWSEIYTLFEPLPAKCTYGFDLVLFVNIAH